MTTTPPGPGARRGDVVLALFPNSDLRTAKTRPALVIQADDLQIGLSQVIVAMIASKMFRGGHPCRIDVALSSPDGRQSLLTDSVVMSDNLATVAEGAIDRVIGSLPMPNVDAALAYTLGLTTTSTPVPELAAQAE